MKLIVAVAAVLALVAGTAAAGPLPTGNVTVDMFKYSDPAFETAIQVNLSGVPGVTGVSATTAGGSSLPLTPYAPNQYAATVGPFASFDDARAATVGIWNLSLGFSGGAADYEFLVHDFRTVFTAASFPPAPTVLYPLDGATGVAQSPTFLWNNGGTHTGALESLFVAAQSVSVPGVGIFESSSSGPIGLNDTSWTPSIVLPPGAATFLVQYETNENEDANVDNPILTGGAAPDPGIAWSSSGDLFSRDLVGFKVTPEPATLALLALGGLLLSRRRRK